MIFQQYLLFSVNIMKMTKIESEIRNPKSSLVWLLLAFTTLAVYFFGLGSFPLLGPDEPRYAQVAREMFERGDWVTPTLGGFAWFEKPALLYWLQIASYKLFGVSEFSARFAPALFGLLTIFSLWVLGRFFTIDTPKEKANCELRIANCDFANWLFLVAASSTGLLVFSRGASSDIILTFPITASLVSFFIFDRSDKKSSFARCLPLAGFYFFIGVALLAKGLVGIVFPLAIVFFYYVLIRRVPCKTFIFSLFWGTILSLLLASLWYAPMYWRHGWTFIDEFFIQHHFARYTSNKYQHPQPFYYFLLVLPLMTLPWLPFFLASVFNAVKGYWKSLGNSSGNSQELTTRNSQLTTFSLAWLVVPLVFFSFSGSKLPGYILPALPAALILTAESVWRFVRNNRKREIALQILAVAVFAGALVFLQFFVKDYSRHESVKDLIAAADAGGFSEAKILNLSMVSHNAEFYGAGRIVRTADGKIRHFWNAVDVAEGIRREASGKTVLVLVQSEYEYQIPEGGDILDARKLADNGEIAIYAVNLKGSQTSDAQR